MSTSHDVPSLTFHTNHESTSSEESVDPSCKRILVKANKACRDSSSSEEDVPRVVDHNSGNSVLGEEWVHPSGKVDLL